MKPAPFIRPSEPGRVTSREYAEALCAAGRYREAADEARGLYNETRDPGILRVYLAAHAHADAAAAPAAYASSLKEVPDPGIYLDYTLLLRERGECLRALATVKKLIALIATPGTGFSRANFLQRWAIMQMPLKNTKLS